MRKKIFITACLGTCLFFVQNLQAKLVKDERTITDVAKYSFKEACKSLTGRDSELIDYLSVQELSCMGTKVDVSKFCDEKQAANPFYIRAINDKESSMVKCYSSKKVIIKYECEGLKDQYCKDYEVGCFLFKEKLAKRLRVAHQSLTDNKKILNCYFETRYNQERLDI